MSIPYYLARYLLAFIFLIELGYKLVDWNGWVLQFGALFPLPLPASLTPITAVGFAVLEGLVALSLIIGKEKFITGIVAAVLLLGIMLSYQRLTAAAYTGPALAVRGILQDQHLWMTLAAAFVSAQGWREMRHRKR